MLMLVLVLVLVCPSGVVWCGVVWCGVVWCGVVWCGVVWCGVVWCGVVWQLDGQQRQLTRCSLWLPLSTHVALMPSAISDIVSGILELILHEVKSMPNKMFHTLRRSNQ